MPDLENIGSALLLTLSLLGVSIVVVAIAMWLVYRFFRHDDTPSNKDN
ncbi:hypothetical protein QCB45_01120 [Thiomicrorhabdus sp. ZW0627]|nr:hypothetical protein [Thiomicrorhabdus sp. ZW0627]MDG6772921.1 hypothetical protein [Thiomicrorhabdus sp. ZW0627]